MILNDILTRQNVITKLLLQNGDKELPKELKVKIMRIRMAYNRVKKQFDDDANDFGNQLITDEFKQLSGKKRTDEEEIRYNELVSKSNSEYREYLIQKGNEEVNIPDFTFTVDEYSDILDINSGNDIEINGNIIKATDLMEVLYTLFVEDGIN